MQKKLYALFLVDQHLRGIRARLDSATRRHKAQQARLEQYQQQQTELNQQHRTAQANAQSLEHQARDMQARVDQFRQQMNNVRSNKEYSALLVEVNTLKIEKGKIEEQALEKLEQVDRFAQQVKEIAERIAEQTKLVDLAAKEVTQAQAEIGQDLEKLTAQRQEAAAQLSPELLESYERAAETHEEAAMAEVIEDDRRHLDYSCGGCYMSIPVELLNSLLRNPSKAILCPNCSRILYLVDALKESFSSNSTSA